MSVLKDILIEDISKENQRLKKITQRLLNKVNKVTSAYRHGFEVSDKNMTSLCNYQIDFEVEYNDILEHSKL